MAIHEVLIVCVMRVGGDAEVCSLSHANRPNGIPTPKQKFALSAMQSGGMEIDIQAMVPYMHYHLKGK
jgi:hypothetical protein